MRIHGSHDIVFSALVFPAVHLSGFVRVLEALELAHAMLVDAICLPRHELRLLLRARNGQGERRGIRGASQQGTDCTCALPLEHVLR